MWREDRNLPSLQFRMPSLVNFLMSGAAKTSADDLLAKMAAS